ncbi:ATP-binding protein [Rothia nasimurium]|uniref:ATP-binding protein n=1 Tax=Rothia nasimurium TaxID=85336 RepID=UPI003B9DE41F
MAREYIERLVDQQLAEALDRSGAVLLEGPKGCGKSETARQVAQSFVQVDTDPQIGLQLELAPHLALDGEVPRVFDEWQVYPSLWNLVRHEVDRRGQAGQFILTGSTAPGENEARHSGAGRFARLRMQTFSFVESGHSDGTFSLKGFMRGEAQAPYLQSNLSVEEIIERICRGGWPANLELPLAAAMLNNRDYLQTVVHVDLGVADGVRRDPARAMRVLNSLARGVGTEMAITEIATDAGINRETVGEYLASLTRIFISCDQPAWSSHVRSRASLRKAPKRHLADPALAVAALHIQPQILLRNLPYAGQLFESQVVHDLQALSGGPVYHGRDKDGLEVDAILTHEGRTCLTEIKLGSSQETVDSAVHSLKKFASRFDFGDPPALLVVTGGPVSYQRPDGVYVVSVGNLGA